MNLLIDGSNIAFRNFMTHRDLKTKKGVGTGALFGTLTAIYKMRRSYPDASMCVFWDMAGGSDWRKKIYPKYKANRSHGDEVYKEYKRQLPTVMDALDDLGVFQMSVHGVEADDLIALAAREISQHKANLAIVVSADQDFYQLLRSNIKILQPDKTGLRLVQSMAFIHKYHLMPKQWPDVRALEGDSSDNIPGVRGIGKVHALKLIQEYENLEGIYNEGSRNDPLVKKIRDEFDEVYMYRELIRIPMKVKNFSNEQIEEIEQGLQDLNKKFRSVSVQDFIEFCRKFELDSILNSIASWKKLFSLEK